MGKPLTLMLSLSLLSPFILVPNVLALVDIKTTGSSSEVRVQQYENSSNSTYVNSSSNTGGISINQSGGDNNVVRINNNRFTVSGKLTDKSSGHISLSGQKILIDKSKVTNFSESGSTNIGDQVTAEGIVINGSLYAEKIYGGTPTSTSSPTSTLKPTNTPNPTSLSVSTPITTVAGESTIAAEINKQVRLSIIQIIQNIFSGILNSLKASF